MRRNSFDKNRVRKNSFDNKRVRKNSCDSCDSVDSVDSSSHSINSDCHINNIKTIQKRRLREQPLEIIDPSPIPDKFKYFQIYEKTKN